MDNTLKNILMIFGICLTANCLAEGCKPRKLQRKAKQFAKGKKGGKKAMSRKRRGRRGKARFRKRR